ncbi:hypothetical protein RchiOBHm_Chr7g0208441 [Rosa chinensis]|uniref:Uncharacterized protein n=1 Tax=Rosa chinensis TaxID=74649 RepID=A0A2P6P9Q0_ROSCH|nr:hypothetical protein RchiOBHm_Chr7g0208441 [Rosa chinensis]
MSSRKTFTCLLTLPNFSLLHLLKSFVTPFSLDITEMVPYLLQAESTTSLHSS